MLSLLGCDKLCRPIEQCPRVTNGLHSSIVHAASSRENRFSPCENQFNTEHFTQIPVKRGYSRFTGTVTTLASLTSWKSVPTLPSHAHPILFSRAAPEHPESSKTTPTQAGSQEVNMVREAAVT